MPVEAPLNSITPSLNLKSQGLFEYEVLTLPGSGGIAEPVLELANTTILFQSQDRKIPSTEPQDKEFKLIEQAPDLVMQDIPNWDGAMEMSRFINDINKGLAEGKSLAEAVAVSAHELEMNIRAFNSEIIKSRAVLPHLNRFEMVNEEMRMVGNNGRPVTDSISSKERNGAVLEGSKQVESSLIAADNNSFAVLMNPAGWNGFTDQFGREAAPHLNAQALVFWKNKTGQLKGLTFHADLGLEQAKNVMKALGVSEEALTGETEKDQIINIVKNPALLSLPQAYDNPFEYVLDKVLAVRGNHAFRLLQEDGKAEIRQIDQIKKDIDRFESLLGGNDQEEKHIAGFIDYILAEALRIHDREIQQQIVYKKEKTILSLTRAYLKESGQIPVMQTYAIARPLSQVYDKPREDNFARERAHLESRRGCPSKMSGSSTMSLSGSSLGSSEGSSSTGGTFAESDQYGSLEFQCPHVDCQKTNKRQRGKLIPNCQHCGKDVRC